MSHQTPSGPPIFSELSSDPDMAELIELFVQEMPSRAETIRTALLSRDWKHLANETHKLRGSAGGHGFGSMGLLAGAIEDAVRSTPGREEAALTQVQRQVDELLDMCARVRVRVQR